MRSVLLAAFEKTGIPYFRYLKDAGHLVRVLDCFDHDHRKLMRRYGAKSLLATAGTRTDVSAQVAAAGFDVALVLDGDDFVRTALILQSLRDAGIPNIIVVTNDASRRLAFRRTGAHSVLIAQDGAFLDTELESLLTWHRPA